MDLFNSEQLSQKSERKELALSGSEFDELDAQLEEIILEEEGEDMQDHIILTPTDAFLLSQHYDILN